MTDMDTSSSGAHSRQGDHERANSNPSDREPSDDGRSSSAEPLDRHRFTAEPPVPASRRAAQVAFIFICVMALIGGGTWLSKLYIRASVAEREEAKKEKERLAKTEAARKGKVFLFDSKEVKEAKEGLPADSAQASNLPRSFGGGAESAEPIPRRGETRGLGASQDSHREAQHDASKMTSQQSSVVGAPRSAPGNSQGGAAPRSGTMMIEGPMSGDRPALSPSTPPSNSSNASTVAPLAQSIDGNGPGAGPFMSGTHAPKGFSAPGVAALNEAPVSMPARASTLRTVQDYAKQQAARMPVTGTPQASATRLGDRSMLLARGGFIPCVLETQLYSTVPGESSCIVPEDVYSDDGRTLLIERGSKVSGVYGSTMKAGDHRIAVVWSRIKTTTGVVIDVESPASDGVGTMGVDGYLDMHWPERIGAALLLSLIEDAVSIEVARQGGNSTPSQGTSTAGTARSLSEKVLDSTINQPPTLLKHRGARLAIFVKRDLWFDGVYASGPR